jgi:hypothetical protein
MKRICVGTVLLTCLLTASFAAAAPIIDSPTGLSNPAVTITFDEVVLAPGTALTTQYAALGVTFSGLFYNTLPLPFGDIVVPMAENFDPVTNPFSIFFNTPQTSAALAFVSNNAMTKFAAYLNGTLVDNFTAFTNTFDLNIYYGFAGGSPFDELRIGVFNDDGFAGLDNIQFGTAAPPAVPEPATLSLIGLGLAGLLARRHRASSGT